MMHRDACSELLFTGEEYGHNGQTIRHTLIAITALHLRASSGESLFGWNGNWSK